MAADDDEPAYSNGSPAMTRSTSSSGPGANSHAGSAFQGGNKIAFDPRDLEGANDDESRVGGKMPRLTIMEEVLLLGIKDKQVCVPVF